MTDFDTMQEARGLVAAAVNAALKARGFLKERNSGNNAEIATMAGLVDKCALAGMEAARFAKYLLEESDWGEETASACSS